MLRTPDAVACTSLSVGYRRPALAGLDLAVAPGQTLALLGSSGSGKTTLLNTIAGFAAPLDGQVWLDGQLVSGPGQLVPPERRRIGMVFQDHALWPHLSVLDTVAYPLRRAGAAKADLNVPVTDHGSYRADLRAFLEASYQMAGHPGLSDLLRALMAEAQIDPAFGDRFRAAFLERRRDALAVIIDRARERGDLPDRPAAGIVADIVFGTIWYRTLATRQPLDADLVTDLVDLLAPTP